MALSETPKCSEAVVEMEEKVNHYSVHHVLVSGYEVRERCEGMSMNMNTYIPAHHDIQQHQLQQSPEPPLVDLIATTSGRQFHRGILFGGLGGHSGGPIVYSKENNGERRGKEGFKQEGKKP